MKLNYEDKWKSVATWLPKEELEQFRAICISHGVTPAAYLRAMITDVLAEEGPKVRIPRRRLAPDIFARFHAQEGQA